MSPSTSLRINRSVDNWLDPFQNLRYSYISMLQIAIHNLILIIKRCLFIVDMPFAFVYVRGIGVTCFDGENCGCSGNC